MGIGPTNRAVAVTSGNAAHRRAVAAGGADRQRVIAHVALIAGIAPDAIAVNADAYRMLATPAALPPLNIVGYRALKRRTRVAAGEWEVEMVPPGEAVLRTVPILDGVIDSVALGDAGWASARHNRAVAVTGGSATHRRAVAAGIVARVGQANEGEAGG